MSRETTGLFSAADRKSVTLSGYGTRRGFQLKQEPAIPTGAGKLYIIRILYIII